MISINKTLGWPRKKTEDKNYQKSGMKKGTLYWLCKNKKDYKRILWTTYANKLDSLGEMCKVLER
jgi:hypothetical protein